MFFRRKSKNVTDKSFEDMPVKSFEDTPVLKFGVKKALISTVLDIQPMISEWKENPELLTEENKEIMRINDFLQQGKAILNLPHAVMAGGFDKNELPRLAVAAPQSKKVKVKCWPIIHNIEFRCDHPNYMCLDWHKFPSPGLSNRTAETSVPQIPPRVLKQAGIKDIKEIEKHLVLFEADWKNIQVKTGDPVLLKPITTELYEIVATWDVSEAEAKALRLLLGYGSGEFGH